MASINARTTTSHVYEDERLAGGTGPRAAKQSPEATLLRLVMSCLLWEDNAYVDGQSVVEEIKKLIPEVDTAHLYAIAVEARVEQKLRHIPLLLVREMARTDKHKGVVANLLADVIRRPDELCEFLSLYWADNKDAEGKPKKTLSAQVKKGLSRAFARFDEYQLAKWNRLDRKVKLRDVLFLCHANPGDRPLSSVSPYKAAREQLYKRLAEGKLATPDTWEVGLSAAKTPEEKRDVWERLVTTGKLGAFAFLKNLRNMRDVSVPLRTLTNGLNAIKPDVLLPIDFLKAAEHAPDLLRELENLMLSCAGRFPKLKGLTAFVVDVSGSMTSSLSSKSNFCRLDAAAAMAVLAAEMCEHVDVWVTAGDGFHRGHRTEKLPALRGFALSKAIRDSKNTMGCGGIFTRQCLEHIRDVTPEADTPDRIIVFSDSQDCDLDKGKQPKPFGRRNYIVDVSPHKYGVNYLGLWTAEISGWSEHFLRYIAALEAETTNGQVG